MQSYSFQSHYLKTTAIVYHIFDCFTIYIKQSAIKKISYFFEFIFLSFTVEAV